MVGDVTTGKRENVSLTLQKHGVIGRPPLSERVPTITLSFSVKPGMFGPNGCAAGGQRLTRFAQKQGCEISARIWDGIWVVHLLPV